MQKLTVSTLTLMLLATLVVASLLSGIITMIAGLHEYSLMTIPAAQASDQPDARPAVDGGLNAKTQDHRSVAK
jgi:hypothetical protein